VCGRQRGQRVLFDGFELIEHLQSFPLLAAFWQQKTARVRDDVRSGTFRGTTLVEDQPG
jgi:hypothetical protein